MAAALSAAGAAVAMSGVAVAQSPVEVRGVEGGLAQAISAALPERSAPRTAFEAERLSDEAAEIAASVLREEGYYGAAVAPAPSEAPVKAAIVIETGPRFTVQAVAQQLTGEDPDGVGARAVTDALAMLKIGAPAQAASVLQGEAAAVAALRRAGFADAKAGARDVVVDHADASMRITYAFELGAPVRFGAVRVTTPDIVRDGYVQELAEVREGAPFDPQPIATLRRDLIATGAFANADVQLAPTPNAEGERDVLIALTPAKPRVLDVGAGWSTADGVGVEASWTLRNATQRADALTVKGALSEQRQSVGAELSQPHGGGRGRATRLGVFAERDISGPFERTGLKISASQDADPRRTLGVSFGAVAAADSFTRSDGIEQALTVSGYLDVRRDDTDDPLDAREGAILEARVEPSISTGQATTGYVRATAQARGYVSVDDARTMTLAARVRAGWVEPVFGDDADIPPDRRFYAGGGGSVRGYAFNSIFPTRAAGETPGGRALVELGAELRGRFTEELGAVAFIDGGAAFEDFADAGDLRWGAGLGLRYDLGFGPLRVDVATPLERRTGDAPVSIYVSIGQAF